jgi:hypothetical protein
MHACRIRCLAAIAIASLPLLGWSAESEQPLSLHMQATAEGIVVTVTATKEPAGKDALPMEDLGRCNVLAWVTADGYIRVAQVTKTSGRSRLDDACLRGVMGETMLPSRNDEGPIDAWLVLPVI